MVFFSISLDFYFLFFHPFKFLFYVYLLLTTFFVCSVALPLSLFDRSFVYLFLLLSSVNYVSGMFQRPPSCYQRMFEALGLLVDFFHANGKGLEMDDMVIDEFEVRSLLLS